MEDRVPFHVRYRLALQALAFLIITLASVGLYFTATAGADRNTWLLMVSITATMLLALFVS
jgi:hypothetical protein